MNIYSGTQLAEEIEPRLRARVATLTQSGVKLKIAAVVYREDVGSVLYTKLKKEAAARVGIEYQVYTFSLSQPTDEIVATVQDLTKDSEVTGIIIQKPARSTWLQETRADGDPKAIRQAFTAWWRYQTSQIVISKDVDGLHPDVLKALEEGSFSSEVYMLPATARAVLTILGQVREDFLSSLAEDASLVCILGKSDILGQPLYYYLKQRGISVEMLGSRELQQRIEQGRGLRDAEVVISATGREHLITGELIKDGVVVIDVGEPKPDVEFATVAPKASFITPVPGGVGPMTVVSLLENAVELAERQVSG